MKPKDLSLNIELLKNELNYCATTGTLIWQRDTRGRRAGTIAGYKRKDGYIEVYIAGRRHLAHRLIWAIVHGSMPQNSIDHINGNPSDNRIENLRDVSHSVNLQNMRRSPTKLMPGVVCVTGGVKSKPFAAKITTNCKSKHLGCFATEVEAHNAYLEAKRQMHEGYTI